MNQAYKINCSQIWGGIRGDDLEVVTSGIRASLFSSASNGGKGGDIYYLSVCASDMLTRIAIADVLGHGSAVSDISEWLYKSLKSHMDSLDGNEVLRDLNEQAIQCGYRAMTTAAVLTFHRGDDQLFLSSAGHHPPLLRRRSEERWQSATIPDGNEPANLPLGVLQNPRYDQFQLPFSSGDQLFLYTDGVIEAPNARDDFFGEKRLISTLNDLTGAFTDIKRGVLEKLERHTGDGFNHDDVTLMCVQMR